MSNFGKVLPAVFGWGLLTLILALLGAFSTILNGLQILNGLFCFDGVVTESRILENDVSLFGIYGYDSNHFEVVQDLCQQSNVSNVSFPDGLTACEWIYNGSGLATGFQCRRIAITSRMGGSQTFGYEYYLNVDCMNGTKTSKTFQLSITPGSLSLMGVPVIATGYPTKAIVFTGRCQLSHHFYVIFSSICVAITGTIFLLRASMRTCCVHFWGFRLSNSVTFYWVFKILGRYGFHDFYNPYMNEPYNLVEGEKFYMLQVQGGDDHATVLEGGSVPSGDEVKAIFVDSFAWSSSNSVYKFTYNNGRVEAYSKDHCGFERVSEANVTRSVASVIRLYLQLKSQSVCITNEEKNQFASLHDCCRMAKARYTLVQQIADRNYHMYGRREPMNLHSNAASILPERELHLFESRGSLLRS